MGADGPSRETSNIMNTNESELFAIREDPSIPGNWGIVWEHSGTQGGFYTEAFARADAIRQGGTEGGEETYTWEW